MYQGPLKKYREYSKKIPDLEWCVGAALSGRIDKKRK